MFSQGEISKTLFLKKEDTGTEELSAQEVPGDDAI